MFLATATQRHFAAKWPNNELCRKLHTPASFAPVDDLCVYFSLRLLGASSAALFALEFWQPMQASDRLHSTTAKSFFFILLMSLHWASNSTLNNHSEKSGTKATRKWRIKNERGTQMAFALHNEQLTLVSAFRAPLHLRADVTIANYCKIEWRQKPTNLLE